MNGTEEGIVEEDKKVFGFDFLGLISGLAMTAAMFFPWWYFKMDMNFVPTIIYPYLIDGPMSQFVGYKRSPTMLILTIVLIVCILLIFSGSFIKRKAGRIFLISSGAIILLAAWRLMARIADVADRFEVPIQGYKIAKYEGFSDVQVWTRVEPGLYLAVIAGVFAILAFLFHKKIWIKVE
jgi:hypothetical protein